MREEVIDWFEEAKADLRHARNCVDMGDFSWACFAAQQGAEKALKASFLALKKSRAPKSHDLTELAELLKKHVTLPEKVFERLSILSGYYGLARYPNAGLRRPSRSLTRSVAEEAISVAEGVVEAVGEALGLT